MPLNFQWRPTYRLLVTAIFASIGAGPAVDGRHSGSRLVSNGNHDVPQGNRRAGIREDSDGKGAYLLEGEGER